MHLQKPEISKNVCKTIKSKSTSRYIEQHNNTKRLQFVLEIEYVQYIYNQFKNLPKYIQSLMPLPIILSISISLIFVTCVTDSRVTYFY